MIGVLAIDKPAGKSSRDVVNHVQRTLRPMKIKLGHTGTLDPLATGVLLVAIGQATRLTEFSHLAGKEYIGTFELGKTSDTLDIEGELQPRGVPRVDSGTAEKCLPAVQRRDRSNSSEVFCDPYSRTASLRLSPRGERL